MTSDMSKFPKSELMFLPADFHLYLGMASWLKRTLGFCSFTKL